MPLPTLEKLLASSKELCCSYVRKPGFQSLYVRKTYRIIQRARVRTLDIAYVVARRPGSGAFTRLLAELHPNWNIYVEGVVNPDLREYLLRRGFTHVDDNGLGLPCYFLHSLQELVPYESSRGLARVPAQGNFEGTGT